MSTSTTSAASRRLAGPGPQRAEIVFPSATVAGLSEYLWKLEQPAAAVANTYFVGAINRVGTEAPWGIGQFYGQSYFANPRGQFEAMGSRTEDELVVADLDLEMIDEVRKVWQFYRDRRPDAYDDLTNHRPLIPRLEDWSTMSHTLIRGGTVVTAEGEYRGDVLVAGETIAAVEANLDAPARRSHH